MSSIHFLVQTFGLAGRVSQDVRGWAGQDLLVVLLLDDVHLADAEQLGEAGPEYGRLLLDVLPGHDEDEDD